MFARAVATMMVMVVLCLSSHPLLPRYRLTLNVLLGVRDLGLSGAAVPVFGDDSGGGGGDGVCGDGGCGDGGCGDGVVIAMMMIDLCILSRSSSMLTLGVAFNVTLYVYARC